MGFFFTALYCTKTALSKFKYPQKSGVFAFSNNVGYQERATSTGANEYIIMTLCPVGTSVSSVKLGQFCVNSDWDETQDWISPVNNLGCNGLQYTFVDKSHLDWYVFTGCEAKEGWYLFDEVNGDEITTGDLGPSVVLPMTAGFITFQNSGTKLMFSGEVLAGGIELSSSTGSNVYTRNASPVNVDIKDLVLSDDWDETQDWIAPINELGCNGTQYTFVAESHLEWYVFTGIEAKEGWYDFEEVNGDKITHCYSDEVSFDPGQGFIVFQNSGATVSVPTAIK